MHIHIQEKGLAKHFCANAQADISFLYLFCRKGPFMFFFFTFSGTDVSAGSGADVTVRDSRCNCSTQVFRLWLLVLNY